MTIYFDDIFRGVAVRRAHDVEEHFINRAILIVDLAVKDAPSRGAYIAPARGRKNRMRYRDGIRATQSHDADAAFTRRRGDRGDGVLRTPAVHFLQRRSARRARQDAAHGLVRRGGSCDGGAVRHCLRFAADRRLLAHRLLVVNVR